MQNQYQNQIESFYKEEKRMPTYSEMMKLFGFKSKNAIYKIVGKLVDAGIVAKDHLGRLVPTETFAEDINSIPKLGLVTAGFPASVEEELADTVDLDNLLVGKKELTYMLEVDGDSMIDAHIEDGDMVLVERIGDGSPRHGGARDGQIVIAEVDGEFTMKYLRKQGTRVWLEPANKKYKPIYPVHSFNIIAVLKAVIRKY